MFTALLKDGKSFETIVRTPAGKAALSGKTFVVSGVRINSADSLINSSCSGFAISRVKPTLLTVPPKTPSPAAAKLRTFAF